MAKQDSTGSLLRAPATLILSLPYVSKEPLLLDWLQAAAHRLYFSEGQICNEVLDEVLVDGTWALKRKSR